MLDPPTTHLPFTTNHACRATVRFGPVPHAQTQLASDMLTAQHPLDRHCVAQAGGIERHLRSDPTRNPYQRADGRARGGDGSPRTRRGVNPHPPVAHRNKKHERTSERHKECGLDCDAPDGRPDGGGTDGEPPKGSLRTAPQFHRSAAEVTRTCRQRKVDVRHRQQAALLQECNPGESHQSDRLTWSV